MSLCLGWLAACSGSDGTKPSGGDSGTTDTVAPPDTGDTDTRSDTDTATAPDTDPPQTDPDRADGLPILFSFHMEAKTARHCGVGINDVDCADDAEWAENMASLEALVDSLDSAGLKGTFQHQIQWLERLDESPEGEALMQKMIDNGHEIALHHHGWGHGDPDGYSNNPDAGGEGFLGTMDDYMVIHNDWETRWNYQLVTMEGTDINLYDGQPEWIYRTSDDQHSAFAIDLDDPSDLCGFDDGSGKPAWHSVTLPSTPSSSRDYTSVGHTYFGKGEAGTAECLEMYRVHILARTQEILDAGHESTDSINMVLHPVLDYAFPTLTDVYDQTFADLAALDGVFGMTVRDYMCERAEECE